MSLRRRRFLRLGALGATAGVAGCAGLTGDSVDGPPPLQFEGAVASQPSTDAPAATVVRIENAGGTGLGVKRADLGGRPFEFVSELAGEDGEVMLLPEQSPDVHLGRGERRREGGCWRVVDGDGEAYVAFISMAPAVHISAGETYTARHRVYYHGPADRCLPPGEYRTEVAVEIGAPQGDQHLESESTVERAVPCELGVGENGDLSFSLS
jgi:hypothetical protein